MAVSQIFLPVSQNDSQKPGGVGQVKSALGVFPVQSDSKPLVGPVKAGTSPKEWQESGENFATDANGLVVRIW
ncbi:MAG: hypothetical protein K9G62_04210 [Alphaproteobacteria bacterium]|nr:hypothetical protein [Alphaproteobacteria bacterium]